MAAKNTSIKWKKEYINRCPLNTVKLTQIELIELQIDTKNL